MDWSGPVRVNGAEKLPAWERIAAFLGHHDCRLYLTETAYVEVGAGSLMGARYIVPEPNFVGCVGRVGRWCEFADCQIRQGGEHDHEQPVNMVFGRVQQNRLAAEGVHGFGRKPPGQVNIGSGVVVSEWAMILGDVKVGDGAVIGAGALLTRNAEPFGIYGGVPARRIRERLDEETREKVRKARWWDFAPDYLMANLPRINELAVDDETNHPRMLERPRLVLRYRPEGVDFLGVSNDEATVPAPTNVSAYVAQVFDPKTPDIWLADCWA